MPTYEPATEEMKQVVADVMTRFHGRLEACGVKISTLVANPREDQNGDPTGEAIKVGGYPALAKIRITSLKDRVHGLGDAELIIDGFHWQTMGDDEKAALIDHELTHLDVTYVEDKKSKAMVVKRDDIDRPKLRMRLHDFQVGWFHEVVRRHGKASQEWQQYDSFADPKGGPLVQLWLPYVDDSPKALFSRPKRGEKATKATDEELAKLPY